MTPNSSAEAVAQGAQLLDERFPGWWRIISLEELEMTSCTNCVCGQVATKMLNYAWDTSEFRIRPNPYEYVKDLLKLGNGWEGGFVFPSYTEDGTLRWDYDELEQEWAVLITARLQADALPTAVEEKEEVLV